jgi:hypothetical protein
MRWDLYSTRYLVWIDGSERTDNFAVERLLLAGWRGDGALGQELHPLGRDLPALLPRVHRVLHLLPDLENKTRTIMHTYYVGSVLDLDPDLYDSPGSGSVSGMQIRIRI